MTEPAYKPHAPTPLSPCPMNAGVVIVKMECGCTVDGCGHLPDPVRPKLCAKHAAAPDMYAALERCIALFGEIRGDWTDPREECREGMAIARAALAKAVSP